MLGKLKKENEFRLNALQMLINPLNNIYYEGLSTQLNLMDDRKDRGFVINHLCQKLSGISNFSLTRGVADAVFEILWDDTSERAHALKSVIELYKTQNVSPEKLVFIYMNHLPAINIVPMIIKKRLAEAENQQQRFAVVAGLRKQPDLLEIAFAEYDKHIAEEGDYDYRKFLLSLE